MKKSAVIAELQRLKQLSEEQEEKDSQLIAFAVIELLLTYGNDPQIREAVDEVSF